MRNWNELKLNRPDSPPPSVLIALKLRDTTSCHSEQFDIGQFQLDSTTGRKLWWHGTHGCQDPIRMKKHHTIWWATVPPFDGL